MWPSTNPRSRGVFPLLSKARANAQQSCSRGKATALGEIADPVCGVADDGDRLWPPDRGNEISSAFSDLSGLASERKFSSASSRGDLAKLGARGGSPLPERSGR